MKKSSVIGLIGGLVATTAAAVAGAFAVKKVSSEIKENLCEQVFTSPEGNNTVTISYGSSDTARGLTYIKVKADVEDGVDSCKMVILAKRSEELCVGEWLDNDNFKLLIGDGKRKQCCDVEFEENRIVASYYIAKV